MQPDTAYRTTIFSDVAPGEMRPAIVEDLENARGERLTLITDPRAKFVGRDLAEMGARYDRRLRGFSVSASAPQVAAILSRVGEIPWWPLPADARDAYDGLPMRGHVASGQVRLFADDPLSAKTSLFVARTEEVYHDALAVIERATAATPKQRADLEGLVEHGRLDERHLDDQTLEVFRLRLDRAEVTRREASSVLMQVLTLNEFSPQNYVDKIKTEFARYDANGKATADNTPFLAEYRRRPEVLVDTVPAAVAVRAVMAAAANSTTLQRQRLSVLAVTGVLSPDIDVAQISQKSAARLIDTLSAIGTQKPLYAVPNVDNELREFEEILQRRIEEMPCEDGSLTRAPLPIRGIVGGVALFAMGNYFTIVDEEVRLYRFDRRDVEFADGPLDAATFNRATFVTVVLEAGSPARAFLPASDTLDEAMAQTKARLLCEQSGTPFVLRGDPPEFMSGEYVASHGDAVAFRGPDGIYIAHRDNASPKARGRIEYSASSPPAPQSKPLHRHASARRAPSR